MESLSDFRSWMQINNAIAALAQAQDRHDWDAVEQAYLPDATYVHPGGRLEGAAAIVDRTREALKHLDASQHLVGTVVVDVLGNTASSTAQFQAIHVRAGTPGGDLYTIIGSYEDRWICTSQGWRIENRAQSYCWRDGNRDVVVPVPDNEREN